MHNLISDRAQLEVGKKFKDILRHLCIDDWQTEPHFQHQSVAECCYQDNKEKVNYLGCCVWNVYALFLNALHSILWIGF
jgi:hypothetical protein